MSMRHTIMVGLAIVAVTAGWVGRSILNRSTAALSPSGLEFGGEPFHVSPDRLAVIESAGRAIQPLHTRLGKPRPGDWLDRHAEAGQTFESYRSGSPSRPTDALTTLYLQKWGEFDAAQSAVVDRVAELLGRFFGMPVKFLGPIRLESIDPGAFAFDSEEDNRRILATYVLANLGSSPRPKDAAVLLALTPVDLTRHGGETWAFGQASLSDRVAVCSLARQGDPRADFTLCLQRTLKTSLHEVGHTLSIPHCAAFACAMNGSNHREEADSRPLWFCHEDEMKVWLACNLDPVSRYARLAAWCDSNGLEAEARFWRRSLSVLNGRSAGAPAP